MDSQSRSSVTDVNLLKRKLVDAEHLIAQLQEEKQQMASEFQFKRSQIKELYFSKENTIREQNVRLLEANQEISDLRSSVTALNEEVDTIKMIASVSENTKQEAVEDLNKHHREEIESLRCVLKDSIEEQRSDLIRQFEEERRRWEYDHNKLEKELNKVSSLLQESQQELEKRKPNVEEEELETSMAKAQQEADKLRSVVLPLENEITELKAQLKVVKAHGHNYPDNRQEMSFSATPDPDVGMQNLAAHDHINEETKAAENEITKNFATAPACGGSMEITGSSDSLFSEKTTSPTNRNVRLIRQSCAAITSASSMPDLSEISSVNAKHIHDNRRLSGCTSVHKHMRQYEETIETLKRQLREQSVEVEQLRQKSLDDDNTDPSSWQQLYEEERKMRSELEESVRMSAEQAEAQIRDLCSKLVKLEDLFKKHDLWRVTKEGEDNNHLTQLIKDRDRMQETMNILKRERDSIRSSYDKHRFEADQDITTLSTVDSLRHALHKYKDGMVAAQVESGHVESKLQSQITFLQDRLIAEQNSKEQIESALSSELEVMQAELASLHSSRSQLEKTCAENRDLRMEIEKEQLTVESIRMKSRDIIRGLRDKLNHEIASKAAVENQLATAKNQLRSLQGSLETSEQVQRDFVQLSQSLQMQLENIRLKDQHASSQPRGEMRSPQATSTISGGASAETRDGSGNNVPGQAAHSVDENAT